MNFHTIFDFIAKAPNYSELWIFNIGDFEMEVESVDGELRREG
jgi:hypothetical protein